MDEYLLNILYDEIDKLSDSEYDRILKDEKILYTSLDEINILTKELNKLQDVYDNIPRDITNLKATIDTNQRKIDALLKLKEAIKNRPNRLASANSSLKQLLETQEVQLAELKELEESEPKILEKYYEQFHKRNTILQNISSEISKGIVNPIILSSFLQNNLIRKRGLLSLLTSLSSFNNSPSLLTNANNATPSTAASAAATGSNI
jgi:chromosome segregation ATPase